MIMSYASPDHSLEQQYKFKIPDDKDSSDTLQKVTEFDVGQVEVAVISE